MTFTEEISANLYKALSVYSREQVADQFDIDLRTLKRWEDGNIRNPGLLHHALLSLLSSSQMFKNIRSSDQTFKFIDLFAGIGGTRLGFESLGGRCVYTCEIDKFCVKTYKENFHTDHPISGDIKNIHEDDIPDHDVLVAGFPCQPFSIAGVSKKNSLKREHGFKCDTQGTLFFDIARIIDAKKPSAFLLENVKNLKSHDGGRTFEVIRRTLEDELGYHIYYKIIDAKHFVPQHRERIFIVGFRKEVGDFWDSFTLPGIENAPALKSILHPEDGTEHAESEYTLGEHALVNDKYTLSSKLWRYLKDYAQKHKEKGNGFGYGIFTADDVARTLSARYFKDGSEILITRGARKNPRRLTPRECARLMGFDDTFKIPVSDTQAYKQFGNSVVVPVIKAIATHMYPYIVSNVQDKHRFKNQQLDIAV